MRDVIGISPYEKASLEKLKRDVIGISPYKSAYGIRISLYLKQNIRISLVNMANV